MLLFLPIDGIRNSRVQNQGKRNAAVVRPGRPTPAPSTVSPTASPSPMSESPPLRSPTHPHTLLPPPHPSYLIADTIRSQHHHPSNTLGVLLEPIICMERSRVISWVFCEQFENATVKTDTLFRSPANPGQSMSSHRARRQSDPGTIIAPPPPCRTPKERARVCSALSRSPAFRQRNRLRLLHSTR